MTLPSSAATPKPDFLVIGAMKCATSTVATYLENHPDVDMVKGCEPRYFSRDENYAKGMSWYDGFFEEFSRTRLIGEGSNEYVAGARYPACAARIAADLPDVKLVMMVRHPIKRIVSAWTQNRSDSGDFVAPTVDQAVKDRPDYLVDPSLYWKNLQLYRAHFDDSRIFVGFMEDLSRNPSAFWAELCGFLEVAPVPVKETIHANPTHGKRVPGRAYTALNQMGAVQRVKQLLPRHTKRFLRDAVFSRPVSQGPQFSAQTIAAMAKLIHPDAQALLTHCGKPADFWDLG